MKIYKVTSGILIESAEKFYLLENTDWDIFINDDLLFDKVIELTNTSVPVENGLELIQKHLQTPIKSQEIWASGVTYFNSKLARQEESKAAGGGSFYARVYEADRPELFFKATAHRTICSGGKVRIRKDSFWNIPEPELTLVITSSGKIIGYTIGNDMSSRDIEGENPLYLPQAKMYDGSASIGPCLYITNDLLPSETEISITINRGGETIFTEKTNISRIKRKFEDLVGWLFKETTFPMGCFLMTGTGVIPPNEFTLQSADEIIITIEPIGTLLNFVE